MWEEGDREVDIGEVIDGELQANGVQVHAFGLGKIYTPLNASVEKDAVEFRVGFYDAVNVLVMGNTTIPESGLPLDEAGNAIEVRNVEFYS
jgi:hypothetical protein